MACFYHPENENQYVCEACGKEICGACIATDGQKVICKECEKVYRSNINYSFSKVPAGLLSLIPGACHMYLGLMERGLLLLLAMAGSISIMSMFNAEFVAFGLVVLWFYSIFDAYHLRRKIRHGELIIQHRLEINRIYLAYGFIGVGGLILINVIMNNYVRRVFTYIELQRIRSVALPLILIIVGIVMIVRLKRESVTRVK